MRASGDIDSRARDTAARRAESRATIPSADSVRAILFKQMEVMVQRTPVTVLLVEDDPVTRDSLAALLRALGHTLSAEVGTGSEAVDAAKRLTSDVVLLDVHLPDMSGIDVAKALHELAPDTAVVFISGDVQLHIDQSAVEATDASAFVVKPVRAATLDATLRLAVARARERRAARIAAEDLAHQLEARNVIDRAKHTLMRRGSSEQEAYRALQRTSQDRSTPMLEIARQILAESGES
jgi:AmiR/NasT family two-component response regulator